MQLDAALAQRAPPPTPTRRLSLASIAFVLLVALLLCAQVAPSAARNVPKRRSTSRSLRETSEKSESPRESEEAAATTSASAESSESSSKDYGSKKEPESASSSSSTDKSESPSYSSEASVSSSSRPTSATSASTNNSPPTSTASSYEHNSSSTSSSSSTSAASEESTSSESTSNSGGTKVLSHGYTFSASNSDTHGSHYGTSSGLRTPLRLPVDLNHNPGKQFSLLKRPPGLSYQTPSLVHGSHGRSAAPATYSDCPLDTGKTKLTFGCSPNGPTLPPNPYFYEKPIILKGPKHTFLSYKNKFHLAGNSESISNANAFDSNGAEPQVLDYQSDYQAQYEPQHQPEYQDESSALSNYDDTPNPVPEPPNLLLPPVYSSREPFSRPQSSFPSIANANAISVPKKAPQPGSLCSNTAANSYQSPHPSEEDTIVNANVMVTVDDSAELSAEENPTNPPVYLYIRPPGHTSTIDDTSHEEKSSYASAQLQVIGSGIAHANAYSGGISNANALSKDPHTTHTQNYGDDANTFEDEYQGSISNSNAHGYDSGDSGYEPNMSNSNSISPDYDIDDTFDDIANSNAFSPGFDDYEDSITKVNSLGSPSGNFYSNPEPQNIGNSNDQMDSVNPSSNEDYDYIYDVAESLANGNAVRPKQSSVNIANANSIGDSISNANAVGAHPSNHFIPSISNANAVGDEDSEYGKSISNSNALGTQGYGGGSNVLDMYGGPTTYNYEPSISNANAIGDGGNEGYASNIANANANAGGDDYGTYVPNVANSNAIGGDYEGYGGNIADSNAVGGDYGDYGPSISNANAIGGDYGGSIANANALGSDLGDYEMSISNANAIGGGYGDYEPSIANANAIGVGYEPSIANANAIGGDYGDYGPSIANANAIGGDYGDGPSIANANSIGGSGLPHGGSISNANSVTPVRGRGRVRHRLMGGISNANAIEVGTNVQFGGALYKRKKRSLSPAPSKSGTNETTPSNDLKSKEHKNSLLPKLKNRRLSKTNLANTNNKSTKTHKSGTQHHLRHKAPVSKSQ